MTVVQQAQAQGRYYDSQFKMHIVQLLPGEYYITREPLLLTTVLGSCITACITDPINKIGGMNHFMLPSDQTAPQASFKYGGFAMQGLVNQLLDAGAKLESLVAKVFGGGIVVSQLKTSQVGRLNAQGALEFLNENNIHIAACDISGHRARRVRFLPLTGQVWIKYIN